jgi:DNA-binding NarL/FixJ family response regulator
MIKALVCGRGMHGIITQFLERHLDQQSDIEVHDHCTPEEMPARAEEEEPDVVLLVVGIPSHDDLANVAEVHERFPFSPVIAVSMALDDRFPVDPLLKAGVTKLVVGEETLDLDLIIREVVAESRARHSAELATSR